MMCSCFSTVRTNHVRRAPRVAAAAVVICCTWGAWLPDALGQSINLDFGDGPGAFSLYPGAGEAGHWNIINGGEETWSLSDLSGAPTAVTITSGAFLSTPVTSSQSAGPDRGLLDDFFTVGTGLSTGFLFAGLQNGMYDVYVYGMNMDAQGHRTTVSTFQDGTFYSDVIGDDQYNGLEQGITHAHFELPVIDGTLRIDAVGDFLAGTPGAVNGIQLVQQVPTPGAAAAMALGFVFTRRRRQR